VFYNDLTFFLKLYWIIRYGKEGCARNEKDSEDMAYYSSNKQRALASTATANGKETLQQEEELTAAAFNDDRK
jgi:hypothetical protein